MDKSIANLGEEQTVPINILNDDELIHIFQLLDREDRIRIERVCKRWEMISKDSWSDIKIISPKYFKLYDEMHDNSIRFRALISRCGNYIREMELPDFSTRRNLSEEIISDIVQFCPNLNSLDISAICVNGSQIQHLADNYKELTSLTIGYTVGKDCDIRLQNLFQNNKKLEHFRIYKNNILTGECLLSLPTMINTLDLCYCEIRVQWIKKVLRNLKNLKYLELLSYIELPLNEISDTINTHSVNLERLKIGVCGFKYTNIHVTLIKLENLKILELINISSVNDDFLNFLTLNCQKLTTIHLLDNGNVTDVGINYLARLPNLEKLHIRNMYSLTAAPFTKIASLKILECHLFSPLTELVQLIEVILNLQVLYITDNVVIISEVIKAMRTIREILSERRNKLKIIFNGRVYS